jgi:hypothetical protein
LFLDRVRHLGGRGGSGGAGARRILEGERLGEPDLANQAERGLKIGLGLARVADDEVG